MENSKFEKKRTAKSMSCLTFLTFNYSDHAPSRPSQMVKSLVAWLVLVTSSIRHMHHKLYFKVICTWLMVNYDIVIHMIECS